MPRIIATLLVGVLIVVGFGLMIILILFLDPSTLLSLFGN